MKRMSTTSSGRRRTVYTRLSLVGLTFVFAVTTFLTPVQQVLADKWDDQIARLQKKADEYQAQANKLRAKGDTLQNKLNQINAQVKTLQTRIEINQKKNDQLRADIKKNQKKLVSTQEMLGEILADLYVDDSISDVELLASSSNIGDFVDKQEYRSAIRDQLSSAIADVKRIRAELEKDKKEVERILADLDVQKKQLGSVQAEQQYLVNETRGKEAAYKRLVAQNKKAIQKARAEQAAYFASLQGGSGATIVAGDPNKGGYPAHLANSPQDSLVDDWGMYNRECVSYVAWKVYQAYGNMPYWGGIGNAWQWAFSGWKDGYGRKLGGPGVWHTSNAQARGIPNGTTPKRGSVAVKDANPAAGDPFGHVAWVEQVLDGGKILISQYNWYNAGGPGWGHYSEMVVPSSMFQRYIYFGSW